MLQKEGFFNFFRLKENFLKYSILNRIVKRHIQKFLKFFKKLDNMEIYHYNSMQISFYLRRKNEKKTSR